MAAQSKKPNKRIRRLIVGALVVISLIAVAIAGLTVLQNILETNHQLRAKKSQTELAWSSMAKILARALDGRMRDDRSMSAEEFETLFSTTKYFQKMVASTKDLPAARSARAHALHLLGRFYWQMGATVQAEKALRLARKILVELIDESHARELLYRFAENNNRLTHLLAHIGRTKEAKAAALEALDELMPLVRSFPNKSKYRWELAITYNNLGVLSQVSGRQAEATVHWQESLSLLRRLFRDEPANAAVAERLLDGQQFLLNTLWRTRQFSKARMLAIESLTLLEHLRSNRETNAAIAIDLANAQRAAAANRKIIKREMISAAPLESDYPNGVLNWRNLSPRDGKTLSGNLLVQGMLPADFELHDALLLSFTWNNSERLLPVLLEIASHTWRNIHIVVLVPDNVARIRIAETLRDAKVSLNRVSILQIPTQTTWVRDYGPLSIRVGPNQYKLVDALYPLDRFMDDHIPSRLGRIVGMGAVDCRIRLTGGNLLSNGKGLCLSTSNLLRLNRQLGYTEEQVTAAIKRLCGAKEVVYLEPLAGELTGDVDWFAAFVGPNTVVVGDYAGEDPENTAILNRNAERLSNVQTAPGKLRVVRIPMPPRGRDFFGGTYTNVVFANKVLLVPTWPNAPPELEKKALDTYRRLLPKWKVVGIDAGRIRLGFGAFRCKTMQLPYFPHVGKVSGTSH